jgi:integrase
MGQHAILKALQRVEPGITAHGMRSAFRDWCAETGVDHDLAELALSHSVGSAVERAYKRSDLFERRRQLAEACAHYCDGEEPAESKVVRLAGRAG